MCNGGGSEPLTALLHGHNGDTHCAVAGLPFVGSPHADGHTMGFAVVLPRGASLDDRRLVLRACAELAEHGLHLPGLGHWSLEPSEPDTIDWTLRPETWTRPSRAWQSATPILLDRFPKKNGPRVEEIVSASCRRVGLPDPVKIEHGPYAKLEGVPPVPAFRLHRAGEEKPRWAVHVRLAFAVPVRGPVLLGAGRYFGLGLLRPAKGDVDDGL
jgi:CRISPR-associated protein Csb2